MKQVFAMAAHCHNVGHGGNYMQAAQLVADELRHHSVKAKLYRWQKTEATPRYVKYVILFMAEPRQHGLTVLHDAGNLVRVSAEEAEQIVNSKTSGALVWQ